MKVKAKQIQITNGKLLIGGSSTSTETGYTIPASVGSNGHVLTSDGTNVVFQAASGSSNSISDADSNTKIQVEESSDENKIRFDTAGTERMIITDEGKVGIGTSSPSRMLDINGDLVVRGGDIHGNATGNPAISVNSTSDVQINYDLVVAGSTRLNTQEYTWPSSQTSGAYLKTDGSGVLTWSSVSGGGGSASLPTVTNVTSADSGSDNYTISSVSGIETTFLINYSITGSTSIVYLPSTAGISSGYKINIKRLTAKAVTLSRSSGTSQTIDSNATISIPYQYSSVTVQTDGTNWFII